MSTNFNQPAIAILRRGDQVSELPAIIIGESENSEHATESGLPGVSIVVADAKKAPAFLGADWTGGLVRHTGVKHESHPDVESGRESIAYRLAPAQSNEEHAEQVAALQSQLTAANTAADDLRRELSVASDANTAAVKRIAELEVQVTAANSRINELEAGVAAASTRVAELEAAAKEAKVVTDGADGVTHGEEVTKETSHNTKDGGGSQNGTPAVDGGATGTSEPSA